MRKKILNRYTFFLVALVFIFSLCFKGGYNVKANQDKPDVNITVTTNKSTLLVNEELEIKYRIEPQPINIYDINKKTNKEIILVVDTSGSMADPIERGKSRMKALQEAAKNFVDKFQSEDNVKIGIVSYDYSARKSIGLTSAKGYNNQLLLKQTIGNLEAEGATNIGDGIRVAAKMFSEDTSVKKYLVLMSDGMPTSLSYSGYADGYAHDRYGNVIYDRDDYNYRYYWLPVDLYEDDRTWDYYGINDTSYLRYGTYGNRDPRGYCLKYSTLMAAELKKSNITNYVIGFSGGSDSTKLTQIAQSGGGTYYDARDAKAINEVYSNLGDQIKADYAVEDVKLNFNLPEGMECSVNNTEISKLDNGYIKSIPNIVYKLNATKTQYVADPFEIIIRIKVNKSGNYTLGDNWQLSYKGINNSNVIKAIPIANVVVNKYNIDFDVSRRLLPEANNGQFNINKEFEIEYTITPRAIPVEISQKPKEIMLVVDTSGSMLDGIDDSKDPVTSRMDLTKKALKNFVDKFKNYSNVRIGIISYTDYVENYNFGTDTEPKYFANSSDTESLYVAIESLRAGGGTHIGEALRRSLWTMSLEKDYQKYLVLMSDGMPSTYTYNKSNNELYYEINNKAGKLDNDYNYEIKNYDSNIAYSYDSVKALEYSKNIAAMVKENKDLDIKSFSIGFSKSADNNELKAISDSAGGSYLDATANDEQAISNVYMGIAEKIKADFALENVKLNEILPEGFTIVDSENNNFTKDLKVNYVYNSEKKQYEAEPIKFKVKVLPKKLGNYDFKDDATFSYEDLEGTVHSKNFNPLNIAIVDDYVVKQGLFQKDDSYKGNYPGENNIKYFKENSINIVNDNLTRLGAFIRTSGQQTNVSIDINENKNEAIKSLEDINVTVFKVNEKGELIKTDVKASINYENKNSAKISIQLPQENTGGYSYYIVNYDFKVNTDGTKGVNMISKCKIEGTNRSSDLNLIIGDLPDLF